MRGRAQVAGVIVQLRRRIGPYLIGRDDHRDILIVLGGGADHRGSADVDVLDQLFARDARLRGELFELRRG